MLEVIKQEADHQVVKAFGQEFIVRDDPKFIKPICEQVLGEPLEEVPELLITNFGIDGQDGLLWTSWEQCLIEYAIVPWDMDANSLIEHALCMVRQSEQSDLMDILAERIVSLEQYQAKQNPLTRRLLAQIGYHVGTHSLKPEIQDRRWKIAVGLGKLLRVLNETEQVDPTDIAARAAEDGNHHSLAAVLRLIRDASEHIIKQIKKTWGL